MLKLISVNKYYGNKQVLKDINLEIGSGEIVGLFGENGAGKTTLMKTIFGFTQMKSGNILLDGEPITRKNINRLAFATCEHSFFPNLDAKGHAAFYRDFFPKFNQKRFDALMKFFELPMNRKISKLSTGQQNQFEVVMALCQGADYIFMDEPFAGNDLFNREDFYKVLLGILEDHETVILSTHLIEEVSGFVGRALFIQKGSLIGDYDVLELEEQGKTLVDQVKESYHYRRDRVAELMKDLDKE